MPAGVVGIACDHTDEDQTRAAFERIASEGAALDLLVTSAWGGYERMVEGSLFTWPAPFWEQPRHRWSSMMDAGARAALDCSSHAARLMVPRRSGLIVNISYWAARKHIGNVVYGMAKAATDKLSIDGALELREHGVAMVSLYPGLVRTEAVLDAAKAGWLDLSNSESPEFIGRVIAGAHQPARVVPDAAVRTGRLAQAGLGGREGTRSSLRVVFRVTGQIPAPQHLRGICTQPAPPPRYAADSSSPAATRRWCSARSWTSSAISVPPR
jgi:NAD(P)-dependent dehydrogenase (short-subunit alcohol dehydrogenase family)